MLPKNQVWVVQQESLDTDITAFHEYYSIAQLNRSTSDVTNAANHKETQASLRSIGSFSLGNTN